MASSAASAAATAAVIDAATPSTSTPTSTTTSNTTTAAAAAANNNNNNNNNNNTAAFTFHTDLPTIRVTQTAGQEYLLADLLKSWGLESLCSLPCSAFRAELVPYADTDEEVAETLGQTVCCFVNERHGADVHQQAGADGIAFACKPQWNTFPRPKIAFKSGWGEPGSFMTDSDYLQLVHSFAEVADSKPEDGRPLNLQMFHRESDMDPPVPVLPDLLHWPLPQLFSRSAEASRFGGGLQDQEQQADKKKDKDKNGKKKKKGEEEEEQVDHGMSVVVDNATRMSKRGALTWWHLDDSGEFVLQTGLPLAASRLVGPVLLGPTGRPVTKLFVYANREDYDLITQDDVANGSAYCVGLDLFRVPGEHLPCDSDLRVLHPSTSATSTGTTAAAAANAATATAAATPTFRLPKLYVALLEAGGRPLLSTPNVPHLVLTVQDCVMIEQRRVSKMCLDEVVYFCERVRRWNESPIFYDFIKTDLQDDALLARRVVRPLIDALAAASAAIKGNNGSSNSSNDNNDNSKSSSSSKSGNTLEQFKLNRAYHSITLLTAYPRVFSISPQTAALVQAALKEHAGAYKSDYRAKALDGLMSSLHRISPGVTHFAGTPYCAAYAHHEGRPRWGPLRLTEAQAREDFEVMHAAQERKELEPMLQTLRVDHQPAAFAPLKLPVASEEPSADDLFD
jgi:hypothetical protein